jgi:hypothetical protein
VSLALLSVKQSRSLMKDIKVTEQQLPQATEETSKQQPVTQEVPKTQNK